jgi:hypothetical protein
MVACAYGQQTTLGVRGYNQFQAAPRGSLTSFTPAPKEKPSSIYLYEDWRAGNIFLKDSTRLDNLHIKIDLKTSLLEIQHDNDIKVLPFSRVLAVTFPTGGSREEVYVNGVAAFGAGGPYKDQLIEIISAGDVSLYGKNIAQIIETKPNEALALSSSIEENKVVIKKRYLITYKDRIIEVDNKDELREDLTETFGPEAASLLKKMNHRKEEDLLELASKLNSLTVETAN